jgi:hypothetical protein
MIQKKINEWDVINEAIEHSRIKRFPYKTIFGESLTSKITGLRLNGLTKEAVFELIKKDIDSLLTEEGKTEVFKRLWISVCARFGAQKSFKKHEMNGRK